MEVYSKAAKFMTTMPMIDSKIYLRTRGKLDFNPFTAHEMKA
jgi:hypothetical protein